MLFDASKQSTAYLFNSACAQHANAFSLVLTFGERHIKAFDCAISIGLIAIFCALQPAIGREKIAVCVSYNII